MDRKAGGCDFSPLPVAEEETWFHTVVFRAGCLEEQGQGCVVPCLALKGIFPLWRSEAPEPELGEKGTGLPTAVGPSGCLFKAASLLSQPQPCVAMVTVLPSWHSQCLFLKGPLCFIYQSHPLSRPPY